jgi:hypothetical protein
MLLHTAVATNAKQLILQDLYKTQAAPRRGCSTVHRPSSMSADCCRLGGSCQRLMSWRACMCCSSNYHLSYHTHETWLLMSCSARNRCNRTMGRWRTAWPAASAARQCAHGTDPAAARDLDRGCTGRIVCASRRRCALMCLDNRDFDSTGMLSDAAVRTTCQRARGMGRTATCSLGCSRPGTWHAHRAGGARLSA